MNIGKVKKVLKLFLKGNDSGVPFLQGRPGIGKSAIVKQLAEENELDFIDLRLSQLDSCDIRGIPRVDAEKNVSRWYVPEFLPFKDIDKFEGTKGILFLDEINRARPDVLQSIFQLVYDRKVGEYELLDDWYIIAAGNLGIEDGTDVLDFDSALKNRFAYIDVDHNLDDWVSWAVDAKVYPSIIGFIQNKPQYLHCEFEKGKNQYVTPRSWHMLSNLLKNNSDVDPETLVNDIGLSLVNGAAPIFLTYLRDNKIPTAKEVLTDYKKTKERINKLSRDMIYQLNNEILLHINEVYDDIDDNTKQKYHKNLSLFLINELDLDNCMAFMKEASKLGENTRRFIEELDTEESRELDAKLKDVYFDIA